MDQAALRQAAADLSRGRLRQEAVTALPAACRPMSEHDGYAIQAELHQMLSTGGLGPVAGHKIGCTTEVMQRFLGIGQPCAGGIFANTVHRGTGTFRAAEHRRLGVECEFAVVLGSDLGRDGAPHDRGGVASAVESCMCAIELVDDRYEDYRSIGVATLIADDFFNAGCVLGPSVKDWDRLDLAALPGAMWISGEAVGSGSTADVMGHPFEALAWLANRWAQLGRTLRAGSFILLGSVIETRWVAAGDEIVIRLDDLGEARATIG